VPSTCGLLSAALLSPPPFSDFHNWMSNTADAAAQGFYLPSYPFSLLLRLINRLIDSFPHRCNAVPSPPSSFHHRCPLSKARASLHRSNDSIGMNKIVFYCIDSVILFNKVITIVAPFQSQSIIPLPTSAN
jgi:hypothetical protein